MALIHCDLLLSFLFLVIIISSSSSSAMKSEIAGTRAERAGNVRQECVSGVDCVAWHLHFQKASGRASCLLFRFLGFHDPGEAHTPGKQSNVACGHRLLDQGIIESSSTNALYDLILKKEFFQEWFYNLVAVEYILPPKLPLDFTVFFYTTTLRHPVARILSWIRLFVDKDIDDSGALVWISQRLRTHEIEDIDSNFGILTLLNPYTHSLSFGVVPPDDLELHHVAKARRVLRNFTAVLIDSCISHQAQTVVDLCVAVLGRNCLFQNPHDQELICFLKDIETVVRVSDKELFDSFPKSTRLLTRLNQLDLELFELSKPPMCVTDNASIPENGQVRRINQPTWRETEGDTVVTSTGGTEDRQS